MLSLIHIYKVICKERGIDLTAAPEPQRDPIEQLAADIDQFSFDYDTYESVSYTHLDVYKRQALMNP